MSDDQIFLFCGIAGLFIFPLIGWTIGRSKGREAFGFAMGLLLGPIGIVIVAILPAEGRRCPFCCGVIPKAAVTCMHCTKELGVRIPSVRD